MQDTSGVQAMPTDDQRGSKPLEGSENQMKGALSSRLLRSGMRVVMSDLAVRPCSHLPRC